MKGIFISYRRDDARHAAGRLADDLSQSFGADKLFRDIEGIDPGLDFADALQRALASCVVMVVLIGPGWSGMLDAQGRRRLDIPTDWIRLEIASALSRGIRVVPVLLEGAALPDESTLPEDLRPLCRRQAMELSDNRWRGDVQRLVEALAKVPGLKRVDPVPPPDPPTSRKKLWLGISLAVAGVFVIAALYEEESGSAGVTPQPVATPAFMPAPALVNATANLSGLWRTSSGESYHFEHNGREVRFTAEAAGRQVGGGRGEFDGSLLRLAMSFQMPNAPRVDMVCDMRAAPDMRSFSGLCAGPNGQFPAQFFR